MKTKIKFLPAVKPNVACLCCGGMESHLSLETVLCQGFGGWTVTRNGELFFMDDTDKEWEDFKKLAYIENKAKRDTAADWMAIYDGPLHGEKYQRQRGKWVLVETNMGFA